jgi:hypothetical protein
MDPIHPILPQPPNIPPVTPPKGIGAINRELPKREQDQRPSGRGSERRRGNEPDSDRPRLGELGSGPHIDVTA